MMTVGDQELGLGESGLDRFDRLWLGDPPERVHRAVGVGGVSEGLAGGSRLERRPGAVSGIGEQAEDGGEVGSRRARQSQAVLLGAWVGALVRTDPALAVVLHADAAEEPVPRTSLTVGAGELLGERP